MILFKDQNRSFSQWPNFTEQELFSKSNDAPPAHQLSDAAINGVQIVRSHFGIPITVNSTYRTKKHNDLIGSNDKSQHRISTAIDFSCDPVTLAKVKTELRSRKGDLWNKLRIAGIKGFGIYKGFTHIDAREANGINSDQFGRFAFWDNDQKGNQKKKS